MLKLASDAKSDLIKLSESLGITEGRRGFVLKRFRDVPTEALQQRYEACIRADEAVKSGLAKDKAALDALMLELLLPPQATARRERSSY